MKLIIDIPEYEYQQIKEYYEKNDIVESTYSYIYHGTPLEKEPCGDCISRKAVKKLFDDGDVIGIYDFLGIGDLPSVQPKTDILDKIRAEIENLPNANPSYWNQCDVVEREDVIFEIIDKYRQEVEE